MKNFSSFFRKKQRKISQTDPILLHGAKNQKEKRSENGRTLAGMGRQKGMTLLQHLTIIFLMAT
jgi:hypothetical protein